MKKIFECNIAYIFFLFILLCGIYHPVILERELIDIDYDIVIAPLEKINSWQDYLSYRYQFMDVQPIRDIFFKIELLLQDFIGHQVFGFGSVLIWWGILCILFLSLKEVLDDNLRRLFVLVVSVHPLITWVIYWPTAQKHLLAVFFISIATLLVKKKKNEGTLKYDFKIFLFYFLASFSQPIIILWPVFYFLVFWKDIKIKKNLDLPTLLLFTFGLTLSLNLFYYSTVYPLQSMAAKTVTIPFNTNLAVGIFSLSRSLAQIFLPISFAINYSFKTIYTFVGLPIFVIICYVMYFQLEIKKWGLFLLLPLLPLITIYTRATNIFVSDTYLVVCLLNIWEKIG